MFQFICITVAQCKSSCGDGFMSLKSHLACSALLSTVSNSITCIIRIKPPVLRNHDKKIYRLFLINSEIIWNCFSLSPPSLLQTHTCRHRWVRASRQQHVWPWVCKHGGQLPLPVSQRLHTGTGPTLLHPRTQLWVSDSLLQSCFNVVNYRPLIKNMLCCLQWVHRGSQTPWWVLAPAHSPVRILWAWKTVCCN